ncbi:MAG TPA: hypothetical protein VK548_18520 [Candidatus Acidoferrum sp.]|nr:hypothetical protein [Candidatus Acidoferrum sp.]
MTERLRTLVLALVLVVPLSVAAADRWPPMLPPRNTLPAPLAADVERAFSRATITRHIEGDRAQAPLDLYVALIDTPEIATALARQIQLARYEVRRLGPDRFFVDDGVGAQGEYQVLVSERGRRVMFSRGRHTGRVVGTITGIGLTELHFEVRDGHVNQRLTAWVLIENRFVAVIARVLIPFFGQVADRKLQEGFRVTARVAEWAASRPAEFCDWLSRQPFPEEQRQPLRNVSRCRPPAPPPRR